MAYVEVDIDIDDFSLDEIVDGLLSKIRRSFKRKDLSEDQINELKEALKPLVDHLFKNPFPEIQIDGLDDEMKVDHFAKVFKKYSSLEVENMLPE